MHWKVMKGRSIRMREEKAMRNCFIPPSLSYTLMRNVAQQSHNIYNVEISFMKVPLVCQDEKNKVMKMCMEVLVCL